MAVAQAGFHKHSAYILANADMPGFSKREQASLARLVIAQRGKLSKLLVDGALADDALAEALCLRLAVLLSRSRRPVASKLFKLARLKDVRSFELEVDAAWLAAHDLTDYELQQEVEEWRGLQATLSVTRASAV